MQDLPVNEIFLTIQGEARWTGTPSMFVRLQGCDVGCPWCDTKHTWAVNPEREVPIATMLAKTKDEDTYAGMTPQQILEACTAARHIVITGGEPCQYDLTELTELLIEQGKTVQVETSGTQPIRVYPTTWVTLSPKIDMPGGFNVLTDAVIRADEIKMPVGKQADIEKFQLFIEDHIPFHPGTQTFWLQPLSQNPKATALCVEACLSNGYNLSVQTHKYLGVR